MKASLFRALALGAVIAISSYSGQSPFTYSIPAYTGTLYTDNVPNTLDLAEMARMSINGLMRPLDPADDDFTLYFKTIWSRNPAVLQHEEGSDGCQAKFVAPLITSRIITGDMRYLDTEKIVIERYLRNHNNEVLGTSGSSSRILEGMTLLYLRDHNPLWKTLVLESVRNWGEQMILVDNGNAGYWENDSAQTSFWAQDPWREEIMLLAYRVFGYEPGLTTCARHINYVRSYAGMFKSSGAFTDDHQRHFHIHGLYLKTFLYYAILTNNTELKAFVKKSFEWAKSSAAGSCQLVGFFPEKIDEGYCSEGCAVSDMVDLAIRMSIEGIGDYWEEADRWIRNYFSEIQLTSAQGVNLKNWSMQCDNISVDWSKEDTTDVSEKNVGAFSGWPSINEWVHPEREGIQHCCTGNGVRSIFYCWENIVTKKTNSFDINLLLNRACNEADIYSYLPFKEEVKVKMREAVSNLRIRMPNAATSVVCKRNGTTVSTTWSGRYLCVGPVNAADNVVVTFNQGAQRDTTVSMKISDNEYGNFTFTMMGNTAINVSPGGINAPLFNRSYFLNINNLKLNSVTRFLSKDADIMHRTDSTVKMTIADNRVTASSSNGDNVPQNMLDGDWSSTWETTGAGNHATFAFDNEYTVSYITLGFPDGDSKTQYFDIQVSSDNSSWQTLDSYKSSGITDALQAFDIPDVKARYLRIVVKGTSSGTASSIHTCEIYVKSDTGNIAPYAATCLPDQALLAGGTTVSVPLNNYFRDPNNNALTYTIIEGGSYNSITLSGSTLKINPVTTGSCLVAIQASDGKGGVVIDKFILTVTSTSQTEFYFEAEIADGQDNLFPFRIRSNESASNGKYIVVPNGYGNQSSPPKTGIAEYPFQADRSGTYTVWVRALAAGSGDNDIFTGFDGSPSSRSLSVNSSWQWYNCGSRTLAAGAHTVFVGYKEDGLKIDQIMIKR